MFSKETLKNAQDKKKCKSSGSLAERKANFFLRITVVLQVGSIVVLFWHTHTEKFNHLGHQPTTISINGQLQNFPVISYKSQIIIGIPSQIGSYKLREQSKMNDWGKIICYFLPLKVIALILQLDLYFLTARVTIKA